MAVDFKYPVMLCLNSGDLCIFLDRNGFDEMLLQWSFAIEGILSFSALYDG